MLQSFSSDLAFCDQGASTFIGTPRLLVSKRTVIDGLSGPKIATLEKLAEPHFNDMRAAASVNLAEAQKRPAAHGRVDDGGT